MMTLTAAQLERSEIFRYMGHTGQEIDASLLELTECCIEEVISSVTPRSVYRSVSLQWDEEALQVKGSVLAFGGNAIRVHLKDCEEVVIMAATLGPKMDQLIQIAAKTDMTKLVILEAIAAEAIEKICDQIEDEIRLEAGERGLTITSRFSPGYGDLPLETQAAFLDTLDTAKKIGLTYNSSFTMIPRKSVTAIIGLYEGEKREEQLACEICLQRENCSLRKAGKYCGRPKISQ